MKQLDQIHALAKQLHLSNLANHTFDLLPEPISNEDFLIRCFKDEIAYREQKAKERRIRQAHIRDCPVKPTVYQPCFFY